MSEVEDRQVTGRRAAPARARIPSGNSLAYSTGEGP